MSMIRKILSLCLACVFIVCCQTACHTGATSTVSSATDNNNTDDNNHDMLFEKALKSDGADSEAMAVQLADAFDKDAEGFIKSLTMFNTDEKTTIPQLLVYGESYGDLQVFEQKVEELKNSTDDADELSVLDRISEALISYKSQTAEVPDVELSKSEQDNDFWISVPARKSFSLITAAQIMCFANILTKIDL